MTSVARERIADISKEVVIVLAILGGVVGVTLSATLVVMSLVLWLRGLL